MGEVKLKIKGVKKLHFEILGVIGSCEVDFQKPWAASQDQESFKTYLNMSVLLDWQVPTTLNYIVKSNDVLIKHKIVINFDFIHHQKNLIRLTHVERLGNSIQ